jgi:spermidine synthase
LGPAGGFLEREVLRYPDVTQVVSLSELDRATFLRSLWPQLTIREVSGDARLRFVSAEPMPWLEQHASSFDLILVCLPGPASAAEGKYYTRYFYELLARRLTSRGVLVVQATSRETLPDTFATLRASLSSAGLTVSSYEAPIPLLGSTSFLVGSRAVLPEPVARTLPNGLRFLDLPALHRSFATLATAPVPAQVSTLAHQHAVVTWHVEQAKLGN